ncbi:hypothetical protein Y958_01170 [Nitrospirillum viridazoti CBAmc]|uniref:Uncharacterized protein n=1 Tax=Nitrospirillum viridazoti CBAmc TaxID=1441467 RepID=A0A248JLI1_9PROT|nr:hypothetical protein Y958_01170 [Nitrospirillum amazonense CBAmc]
MAGGGGGGTGLGRRNVKGAGGGCHHGGGHAGFRIGGSGRLMRMHARSLVGVRPGTTPDNQDIATN